MKRCIALLLCALTLCAIAIPSALAEGAEAPVSESSEAALSAPDVSGGEAAAQTPAPETAQPNPADAAPDAPKTLTASSIQNAANAAHTLAFGELRTVLTRYNGNIRTLYATLNDLDDTDVSAVTGAVNGLLALKGTVESAEADARRGMSVNSPEEGEVPTDLYRIYSSLTAALAASGTLLAAQANTLDGQTDSVWTSSETGRNTIENSINQIIKGAETLYVGILTMEDAAGAVERGIAALDRAVAITEKQQSLGMASAYDVETIKYRRAQTASQLESLNFQIKTSKLSLEGMCGMELTGTVELAALPMPTDAELSAVNYEKNLKAATALNVDVMNADAKLTGDEGDHATEHRTYDAAVSSFACNYKLACLAVPEKARLADVAQQSVAYQQRTFAIAEKKYGLGMLSHEEYLSAQSELQSAQDSLASARKELFTAYRSYVWATEYGIA